MKFGSVCSGIEAASVAWHQLGWSASWLSEIEKFPSQVLAHHYPDVPNFGDMTKFKEWKNDSSTAIDVLVGGTPCQSFSVAGLRKGLDDPRGNLMLTYLAIARQYQPKWLVWENVPGVLSSNGGNDFASFLRGLAELGYGFAYRVLDAQYFGVAQRRRRVFVVGCFGDWRSAAAVLFERHSLSGHPAPSRKKREKVAATITARFGVSRNNHEECIAQCFEPRTPDGYARLIGDISPTLNRMGGGQREPCVIIPEIAKCLTSGISQRFDAETETMLPIALAENTIGRQPQNGGNGDGFTVDGPMYTLNATGVHGVAQPKIVHGTQDPCVSDIAFAQGRNNGGENVLIQQMAIAQPIGVLGGQHPNAGVDIDRSPTLTNAMGAGGGHVPIVGAMAVRRLTPTECERLQGFPDGYTDIKPKGKQTPDGPRYKALGNSMAVPVMKWIGERINNA